MKFLISLKWSSQKPIAIDACTSEATATYRAFSTKRTRSRRNMAFSLYLRIAQEVFEVLNRTHQLVLSPDACASGDMIGKLATAQAYRFADLTDLLANSYDI